MAGKKQEKRKYIVIPRTNDASKEGFVKVNGKVIVFDKPIHLDERDVSVLNSMKEPMHGQVAIDPKKIMEEMHVNQEMANSIARARASTPDVGSRIEWVRKYSVHPA